MCCNTQSKFKDETMHVLNAGNTFFVSLLLAICVFLWNTILQWFLLRKILCFLLSPFFFCTYSFKIIIMKKGKKPKHDVCFFFLLLIKKKNSMSFHCNLNVWNFIEAAEMYAVCCYVLYSFFSSLLKSVCIFKNSFEYILFFIGNTYFFSFFFFILS